MTLGEFTAHATAQFRNSGFSEPLMEAHHLIAGFLDRPRSEIISLDQNPLDQALSTGLSEALARRLEGEPLAYILEFKDFFKSRFNVRSGVLIPRPETEVLVESALDFCGKDFSGRILDVGCGSGCIGLSLLIEWPNARLVAIDSESIPIQLTEENAKALGVAERAQIIETKFSNFDAKGKFDLIVANPPYIDIADQSVEPHVRKFEPSAALFADKRGFGLIEKWLTFGTEILRSGGHFLMEIGAGQAGNVSEVIAGLVGIDLIRFQKDLAGHDRVVVCKRR